MTKTEILKLRESVAAGQKCPRCKGRSVVKCWDHRTTGRDGTCMACDSPDEIPGLRDCDCQEE